MDECLEAARNKLDEMIKGRLTPSSDKENIIMSMTAFILIIGPVLLTMAAINEAIELLVWLYEHDNSRRRSK